MDTKKKFSDRGIAATLLGALLWIATTAARWFFGRSSLSVQAGLHPPAPPTPPNANPRSVESGHEVTDVSVGGVFLFGFGLAAGILIVLGVALLYFRGLGHWAQRADVRRPRLEPAAASLVPTDRNLAGPLLQVKPEEDLKAVRAGDADALDTYGWIDRGAGIVRLPVERAMDLVAARGLPPVSPGKTAVQIQQERALPENRADDHRQSTYAPAAPASSP